MVVLLAAIFIQESTSQRRQQTQETRPTRRTNSNRNNRNQLAVKPPSRETTNTQSSRTADSNRRQFDTSTDYFDYEPLPQGPTRQSTEFQYDTDDYFYDYYDYDPLPSGPTREPPLPSGPTRRPGQPTRLPPAPQVGVSRDVYRNLPLLTTRPPPTETPRRNVNFRIPPPRNRGTEPLFELPVTPTPHRGPGRFNRPGGRDSGVLVRSSLDILDQTRLFSSMDPNQEQFIKTPRLNAGALPLAFEAGDSNDQYFFPPLPPLLDGP